MFWFVSVIEILLLSWAIASGNRIYHTYNITSVTAGSIAIPEAYQCRAGFNSTLEKPGPDKICLRGQDMEVVDPNHYDPNELLRRSVRGMSSVDLKTVNGQRLHTFLHNPMLMTNVRTHTNKIRSREDIFDPRLRTIGVLGGSLTAGRMVGGYEGAWPAKLQTLLRTRTKESNSGIQYRVVNVAEPATTTFWALQRLRSLLDTVGNSLDLVIVDYDVNDCAVIDNDAESRNMLLSVTELLVRRILEHPSRPAVVFMNVAMNHHGNPLKGDCSMYKTCYSMYEVRKPILDLYGIPQISQRDAIWDSFDCNPLRNLWPCSKFCSHPMDNAHSLLADLAFGFISGKSFSVSQGVKDSDIEDVPGHDLYDTVDNMWKNNVSVAQNHHPLFAHLNKAVTDTPASVYNFLAPKTAQLNDTICYADVTEITSEFHKNTSYSEGASWFHRSNASCWNYQEDVKDKFGWIAEGCVGDSLIVPVAFGSHPVLIVTALITYSPNFGLAEVSLSPPIHNISGNSLNISNIEFSRIGVIDSINDRGEWSHHSLSTSFIFLPKSTVVNSGQANHHVYSFPILDGVMISNSQHLVKFTLLDANALNVRKKRENPQKFKLISISTC